MASSGSQLCCIIIHSLEHAFVSLILQTKYNIKYQKYAFFPTSFFIFSIPLHELSPQNPFLLLLSSPPFSNHSVTLHFSPLNYSRCFLLNFSATLNRIKSSLLLERDFSFEWLWTIYISDCCPIN